ncbi:hypothetical protein BDB00DRAFT_514204 [Zychaea mexicana]|uniref:uncharacterized protein n=1 Tax=Zychaea mexicana TaxID=64656 RepID=UPI0022FECC89|nr:uncharacterized protein BDB00DRAFT_514204 [Zychaea mexicana]KAI9491116.1 hypothetical protein BDB00DRAFT_514204 [Zychaea mexicana]
MSTVKIYTVAQLPSLPHEIQHKVFERLSFDECKRCSQLSRAWRSAVLNWPGMWRCLQMNKKFRYFQIHCDRIEKSALKGIDIDTYSGKTILWIKLVSFLAKQNFNAINWARLKIDFLSKDTALMFLNTCGNALSYLHISLHLARKVDFAASVGPDMFVQKCPNLTKLTFIGPIADVTEWRPSTALKNIKHQRLTDLALVISNIHDNMDIVTFLKAVPKLKYLAVSYNIAHTTSDPSFPMELQQYCPDLATIVISDSHISPYGFLDTYDEYKPKCAQ